MAYNYNCSDYLVACSYTLARSVFEDRGFHSQLWMIYRNYLFERIVTTGEKIPVESRHVFSLPVIKVPF